ncbi:PBSX family phage terminase large subunit [Nocardia salmonicida]|uniref:PBSX family phage terminase large subunit n=1 Tax=Nocardia salmonicida TaxID=53431 RepID=UPI0036428567
MKVTKLRGKARLAVKYSTASINVLEGSVRSGKTIGSLLDWADFIRHGPAGNLLMAGRTERTLINNLLMPMQEIYGADRVVIGDGTATIFGRTVLLVGANNEQARTKIQGLTLAGAYCDEVATMPESFWNMLVTRMSVEGSRIIATCNPEGPRHWFKRHWLDRAKLWVDDAGKFHDRRREFRQLDDDDAARPLDLHRFTFTLDDNAHNLPPGYISSVKASYSGVFYLRMIRGLWALADGVIYESFDPGKDVVAYDQIPPITRLLSLGIDYGTTNPTAGILLGLGADGRLYALDEWSPPRGTDAQLSASLTEWMNPTPAEEGAPAPKSRVPEWVYVDPAAASFKLQLFEDGTRATDATNDVLDGIRAVSSLLSTGQLLITDRCPKLADEIPGYMWDPKASEDGTDKPIKQDDHFCDGLRYAVNSSRAAWYSSLAKPIPTAA